MGTGLCGGDASADGVACAEGLAIQCGRDLFDLHDDLVVGVGEFVFAKGRAGLSLGGGAVDWFDVGGAGGGVVADAGKFEIRNSKFEVSGCILPPAY